MEFTEVLCFILLQHNSTHAPLVRIEKQKNQRLNVVVITGMKRKEQAERQAESLHMF